MIARIKLDFTAQQKLADLAADPLVYEQLRMIFGTAPTGENIKTYYYWPDDTLIDIDTDGPTLTGFGIVFQVTSFKGTLPLTAILPKEAGNGPITVHVQIPHVGLLAVDEVEVVEDYCTDRLQRKLDDGWRILCVCPPNAARRPDYILGRTKR